MEKYVFCDLDDSLVIDGQLNEKILYLYNNLKKATWVINTGRSCTMAIQILSYLNFANVEIIGLNGNQLTTEKGILSLKMLEKETVNQVIDLCSESQSIINFYSSKYEYYLSFKDKIELCINHAKKNCFNEKDILVKALQHYVLHFENFLEYSEKKEIDTFKLTIIEAEKEMIQYCKESEIGRHCELLFLNNSIELLPKGIDKGTGIKKYFELNKKKQEDYLIVAIGDAENDKAMFVQADVSVASQRSTKEIRDRGDFIIGKDSIEDILKGISSLRTH
ncbi:HAD hydrolase family protein [Enterococcus larvae]|uniref:HAD hydrolase family protein n=1 Tax=Enterococcus larvae TaxID=2794352 RepID=UPI003F3FDA0C